jgi:RNA polymerase sigma-70 factor, ECF subfamily
MDFESIYKKYYSELYHFASRQALVHAEAADILQDIFTNLYKQQNSGIQVDNPRAWLYKALLNLIRTDYRIHTARTGKAGEILARTPVSTDSDTSYNENERRKIVESCISRLEAGDKNLLLLYHKGFSYKEISEILLIPYASVGTYISRATTKLKSILINEYHELFE